MPVLAADGFELFSGMQSRAWVMQQEGAAFHRTAAYIMLAAGLINWSLIDGWGAIPDACTQSLTFSGIIENMCVSGRVSKTFEDGIVHHCCKTQLAKPSALLPFACALPTGIC